MMLWRILFRSWTDDIKTHLLSIFTTILASGLIAALLFISVDIGDKMSVELKSYGSNILIEPASNSVVANLNRNNDNDNDEIIDSDIFLDEKELPNIKTIFWSQNIIGFAPFVKGKVKVGDKSFILEGTFFDQSIMVDNEPYQTGHKNISTFWKIEGRYPKEDINPDDVPNEVLIGKNVANDNFWKIGDEIIIHNEDNLLNAKIVGILNTGAKEDNYILSPLFFAQKMLNLKGKVQGVNVSALTIPESEVSRRAYEDIALLDNEEYDRWYCSAYVSAIVYQLEEVISGAAAKPVWQVVASEGYIIKKIQLLLLVSIFAALLASSMGIASLTVGGVMKRSSQIGLMKAIGAKSSQIKLLFHLQSIVNGIIGGLIGSLLGFILANMISFQLFNASIKFTFIVLPTVLFISLLIGFLGTWIATRKITKYYPAEILYGKN